jgi:spermidine synthase
MAHMPLAFLGRPARNGLVICFGMGTTFRSMLSWGIDTTVVELNPSVPKLFSYFHPDGSDLVKSPLAHVVIDDGRRYLERSSELYDVITMDPPPPISTPTTSLLYSSEFYEVVKKHLRPGGILQAWLAIRDPGWDLSTQTAFAKALRNSFPYIRVFPSLGGWGFHMLASESPLPVVSAQELARRMPSGAAADFVEWNPGSSGEEMFTKILKTEQQIDRIASMRPAIPPIQDNRPINEYFFLRRLAGPYP